MKTSPFAIVLVTAPDAKTARQLATNAVAKKLIACANIVPKIESIYRWKGKVECGTEVLMILKAKQASLKKLEEFILERHPYDTPEFLVLAVKAGSRKYLAWLSESCE